MADTKISALTAASSALAADELPANEAGTSKKVTINQIRTLLGISDNASTAAVSAGYSSETYMAGSAVTFPNAPGVGSMYHCLFDMTKTAAGTAAAVIKLYVGTNGTTGDNVILTFTFVAGTAAADVGTFEVWAVFRTVGSGTSAVLAVVAQCRHTLSVTGLTGTAAVSDTLSVVSSGFDSTVANSIIGVSFNGGASFSGTNNLVYAEIASW